MGQAPGGASLSFPKTPQNKGCDPNSCSVQASRPQEWLAKASLCSPEPFPGAGNSIFNVPASPAPGAPANEEIHPGGCWDSQAPLWSKVLPSWASSDTNGSDLMSF